MESQIKNTLADNTVLGFPKTVWNANFGISFYPKEAERRKWIIRVFGYSSINRKFSEAPVHLTPYGFGIEFNR